MSALGRGEYAARYGPTTGDRVRLADTWLWVEVEPDDVFPGDELIGGCGKTARDGVLVTSGRGGGRGSARHDHPQRRCRTPRCGGRCRPGSATSRSRARAD